MEIKFKKNNLNSETIYVFEIEIIRQIEDLIQTLTKQQIQDYMDWHIILSSLDSLDERFMEIKFVIYFKCFMTFYLFQTTLILKI